MKGWVFRCRMARLNRLSMCEHTYVAFVENSYEGRGFSMPNEAEPIIDEAGLVIDEAEPIVNEARSHGYETADEGTAKPVKYVRTYLTTV